MHGVIEFQNQKNLNIFILHFLLTSLFARPLVIITALKTRTHEKCKTGKFSAGNWIEDTIVWLLYGFSNRISLYWHIMFFHCKYLHVKLLLLTLYSTRSMISLFHVDRKIGDNWIIRVARWLRLTGQKQREISGAQ